VKRIGLGWLLRFNGGAMSVTAYNAVGIDGLRYALPILPCSTWRKIARIWGAIYFDCFIKISSIKMPRKSYLSIPLISGGISRHCAEPEQSG
jgi:hypothetical protein